MMFTKFKDLRFDTPDNSHQSLRILAEHIRRGDILLAQIKCDASESDAFVQTISIEIVEPRRFRSAPSL